MADKETRGRGSSSRRQAAGGKVKPANRRVQPAESDITAFFDNFYDGILVSDVSTRQFVFGNLTIQHMLGYTLKEITGLSVNDIHPQHDLPHVLEAFDKLAKRQITVAGGIPVLRKDGSTFYADINAFPVEIEGRSCLAGVFKDVTGQRKLRDELQMLAATAQHSSELVNVADTDGRMIFLNEAGCKMLGIEPDKVTEINIIDVIPEHLKEKVRLEVVAALANGSSWEGELQYRNVKTDSITDVYAVTFPIKELSSGTTKLFANVSLDITDRKKSEKLLQDSEERFRRLTENAPDVIYRYRFRPAPAFEYMSPAVFGLAGYSPDEFYADPKFAIKLIHPEDKEIYAQHFINRQSMRKPLTLRWIHKDGHLIWTEEIDAPINDSNGKLIAVEGIVRDVTERKKAADALSVSNTLLARSQEIAHIGSWTLDQVNNVLNWSDETYRIFGLQPQEFAATYKAFLEAVHPEDRGAVDAAYSSSLHEGKDTYEIEHRVVRGHTGEIRNVYEKCIHERNEAGDVVRSVGIVQDITERKQVEKALIASEEQYRLLADHTTDTIWLLDMNLKMTYHSPSGEKLRGFTVKEIMEMPGEQTITPESLKLASELFFKEIPRVEADPDYNPIRTLDLEYTCKDGSTVWAESKFSIIRDQQGKAVSILGEGRDITDRKRAEDALRESEARYRLVSEHTTDFVWLMDMDLKPTYQSPSAEKLTGFTVQELMDLPFERRVAPDSLRLAGEVFLAEIPKVQANPEYNPVITMELEICRKDGTTIWSENKFSIIRDGNRRPVSIIGEARDITERKRSEDALRSSEEKYKTVVENAREAMTIAVGGLFRFVNRRTTELTGYTYHELISKPFIEFVYSADRQMVADRYNRRLAGLEVPDSFEFRAVFKAGDIRWVELTAIPVTWEGEPATLSFMTDITERKKMEDEQQRVSRLESLGLLAGGIAHDFNNILTSILGNVSLAAMETSADSEIHGRLEDAQKAVLRAKDLTGQLLTFSRGGAPVKKLASLDQLLRDTAGFALAGSNISLICNIPAGLWPAEVDAGQVSQVIHNLITNAQQAMPQGGEIDLTAENLVLDELQSLGRGLPLEAGKYIRIAVKDHGSGIPAQHLGRIFDPFFTTKQKGSGLGLATSFSIARNHGGHLSVESKLGVGSTFYLYLPASMEKPAPIQDTRQSNAPLIKARILIMDDEEGIRKVADRLLRRIGYEEIGFAVNGTEALRLYSEARETGRPFDVVILDLTVPGGMGGEETMKRLLEIDPAVKAIVSSGYAAESVMANYREHGFRGMVAKPYTPEELAKVLHDVLMETDA